MQSGRQRHRAVQAPALSRRSVLALGACSALAACDAQPRVSYSIDQAGRAQVPGYGFIRLRSDATPAEVLRHLPDLVPKTRSKPPRWLSLSGGGAGGAYGAGFLLGWEARGDRPTFDLVTGISAGALISPFAFIGEAGDAGLDRIFQPASVKSLQRSANVLRAVFGPGAFQQNKLLDLVSGYCTPALIEAVAARHRTGARLMVQTTDLDSGIGYIWNLGAVATSDRPGRVDLFRRVLTASASIPGVFPAQPIRVEAGGRRFRELHTDGGAISAILAVPTWALTAKTSAVDTWRPEITMIFDQALDVPFEVVPDRGLTVVQRATTILTHSMARQNAGETYAYARQSGLRLRVADIRKDLGYDSLHPFASPYIRAARALGYADGRDGNWDRRFTLQARGPSAGN